MQNGRLCAAPGPAADSLAFLWRLRRDSFFPSRSSWRGGSDTVRFQMPRIPMAQHLALLCHSIIDFWPEAATCRQCWRCFPQGFTGPPGVRRAPGCRGCSRSRALSPARRGSSGTCTGPQLPLAASGCPPHGPLGCPPPPLPRVLPAPAPTPFHRKSRRQKPNGAAVPPLSEVASGCGDGTREGSATRAVPRLHTGGVNGIVAPVTLRGLPNFFQ